MAGIGKYNTLKVNRKTDFGYYLNGGNLGEILLPLRYAPENCKIGDKLEVFIYLDSEDRLIATTEKPLATVGEFARLKAVSTNDIGAFLYWGLPKDLLVPYREQKQKMEAGKYYVVFIYIDDETNRIAASAKLSQFLGHEPVNYVPGDEVDLFIMSETVLGYKAAINKRHEGILYKNEVFSALEPGQQVKGYIRKVRDDGKIDLRLSRDGFDRVEPAARQILEYLQRNNGHSGLSDKSPADLIYTELGMSKKVFKQAIGNLYKKGQLIISDTGLALTGSK